MRLDEEMSTAVLVIIRRFERMRYAAEPERRTKLIEHAAKRWLVLSPEIIVVDTKILAERKCSADPRLGELCCRET